jgi:hypothetical protein
VRAAGLVFAACFVVAGADAVGNDPVRALSPALAAFYTVDTEGQSVRETPAVEAIATRRPEPSLTIVGSAPGTSPGARRDGEPPSKRVQLQVRQVRRSALDAYRCERYGFYYARDGRCVLAGGRAVRRPVRRQYPPR